MSKSKITPLARIVNFGREETVQNIDEAIGILRLIKAKRFPVAKKVKKTVEQIVKERPLV